MAVTVVLFDPEATAGSKFKSAAVRDEIAAAAQANLEPGSIVETLIADEAVTEDKIGPQAVTSGKLAVGAVKTANIDTKAVTTDKILPGAITPGLVAPGIAIAFDTAGNPITLKLVPITAAAYDALDTPDAGTLYFVRP